MLVAMLAILLKICAVAASVADGVPTDAASFDFSLWAWYRFIG